MNNTGKKILLGHCVIIGFVLIKLGLNDIMDSYIVNNVFFFVGAILLLGSMEYWIANRNAFKESSAKKYYTFK